MSDDPQNTDPIDTLPILLAHALAMESEAAERYGELADQMEVHRRTAVAAIFRRLEQAEKAHLGDLTEMCAKFELPHIAPWDFKWRHSESPEAIDFTKVHYQLSVREAILLAFEHERRAAEFYAGIAQSATDPEVQKLAREFAAEEQQHIGWLEAWLAECGPGDALSIEDTDPPLCQE